jgi:hypothetical protein
MVDAGWLFRFSEFSAPRLEQQSDRRLALLASFQLVKRAVPRRIR